MLLAFVLDGVYCAQRPRPPLPAARRWHRISGGSPGVGTVRGAPEPQCDSVGGDCFLPAAAPQHPAPSGSSLPLQKLPQLFPAFRSHPLLDVEALRQSLSFPRLQWNLTSLRPSATWSPGPLSLPVWFALIPPSHSFNKYLSSTYYVLMLDVRCARERTLLTVKELPG